MVKNWLKFLQSTVASMTVFSSQNLVLKPNLLWDIRNSKVVLVIPCPADTYSSWWAQEMYVNEPSLMASDAFISWKQYTGYWLLVFPIFGLICMIIITSIRYIRYYSSNNHAQKYYRNQFKEIPAKSIKLNSWQTALHLFSSLKCGK